MRAKALLYICVCLFPLVSHAAAIHDAAKKGDTAAITSALDAGANVNDPDGFATPLYYAVSRQHLDAAKLLIERGADVNAGSKTGGPLKAAVAKDQLELITLLLQHGADPNAAVGDETVLHQAVRHGCLDCVEALVTAGADVNAPGSDPVARTPIHLARFYDHSEISEYLMANGVVLAKPGPITSKLVSADVEKGRAYFDRNCDGCHNNEPGKGAKEGFPNLWGVVGRDKASSPEAKYSKTLLAWGGVWTYEDLSTYLYGPTLTTPGVFMEMPGVSDETERVDLIAYLRTLSDKPIPLP